ncbi:MAG: Flp pilus assembly protein CpaB, partial [Cyanobacteria bacterium]|nr:Flp pilus assembly protein CpaB [Cyanobacteriota bacterium]
MPTPKKPKKAIVFFVIALVVAGVVAIGAISVTMIMIGNANNNASATAAAKKKAEEEAKQAKEELERLKKAPPVQTVQEVKYREIQAITDIPPGTVVKDNMIASVEIKQDQLTPGSLEDETDVVGKVTTVPLKNGETLTKSKIMDNEGGFFIKDGQRAITIQVDQVGGLNGAVQPGSFVDVIATFVVDEKEKL